MESGAFFTGLGTGLTIGGAAVMYVRRGMLAHLPRSATDAAEPSLESLSSDVGEGMRWTVSTTPLIIGRDPDACDACLPESLIAISRQHCAVWWDAERSAYRVRDEGSSNGTFTDDGVRCEEPDGRLVPAGSVIYLGSRALRFRLAAVRASSGGAT